MANSQDAYSYCVQVDPNRLEELSRTSVGNLLMNMSAGLMPSELSPREKALLVREYGENWMFLLGFVDENGEKTEAVAAKEARINAKKQDTEKITIYVRFPAPCKFTDLRKKVKKGTCAGNCGKDGHIIPAGVFDRSVIYCADCYHKR